MRLAVLPERAARGLGPWMSGKCVRPRNTVVEIPVCFKTSSVSEATATARDLEPVSLSLALPPGALSAHLGGNLALSV